MIVRVRLFAIARQLAGLRHWETNLPDHALVADLRRQLAREIPAIAGLLDQLTFAIDAKYAGDCEKIPPGADVACIPPVSGG